MISKLNQVSKLSPAQNLKFARLNRQQVAVKNDEVHQANQNSLRSLALLGKSQVRFGKSEQTDFLKRLKHVEAFLNDRVLGQEDAIKTISRGVRRHYAAPVAPKKPLSYILLGPTGVGKTETARSLQEFFTGDPEDVVKIDLGSMQEHETSMLKGAPPSFVGRDAGALLAKKVKAAEDEGKTLVFLFDEAEKAKPGVLNDLLSVLDDGSYQIVLDGSRINLRRHVIMLTSNVGSREYEEVAKKRRIGFGTPQQQTQQHAAAEKAQRGAFENWVSPEFANRIDDVVVYKQLPVNVRRDIAAQKLRNYMVDFGKGQYNGVLTILNQDQLITFLGTKMEENSHKRGGRQANAMIDNYVANPLADFLLDQDLEPGSAPVINAEFVQTSKGNEPLNGHLVFTLLGSTPVAPGVQNGTPASTRVKSVNGNADILPPSVGLTATAEGEIAAS